VKRVGFFGGMILNAVLFFAVTSASYADCSGANFTFKIGQQSHVQRVTDGTPCLFTLRFSGSPIYGTEVVARPKHGSVRVSDRTTLIYYPSPTYKGPDEFTFQWIGKEGGVTPGATTVNVSVTIQ
jgi:hypothetical protein